MLNQVSISTRLRIAVGTLLIVLLLFAALATRGFQDLAANARELVDRQARFALLADRANQHAQQATAILLRLLLTAQRDDRVPLYKSMDEALAASDQAISTLATASAGGELGDDTADVVRLRERFGQLSQETVEMIELDGPAKAQQQFERETEPALYALLMATNRLASGQQDRMQTEVERLTRAATESKFRIAVIALLALVVGGAMAAVVARSIIEPVKAVSALADSMAAGDYTREIPAGGGDELGAMLRAFGSMRERIAQRESHIRKLAYSDALTGLANRTQFFERFAALPAGQSGALALVNIDRFSPINKALGHAVGDRLLCQLAERLAATASAHDVVARFSGDEFAVLFHGADRDRAAQRAGALLEALRKPTNIDGQRLDIDASMGIAMFNGRQHDLSDLLRAADAALRVAKRRRTGVVFGDDHVESAEPEQLSLIGEMRDALANGEFVTYYQPKLQLHNRRVVGAEALIRWQHPTRGLVPPGRFIPFAEQTGFIREITPWLIGQVVGDLARWQQAGITLPISVNLSTLDLLNADLIDTIIGLLRAHHVPAAHLCLEITESALMEDPERALGHLAILAEHGLKLAIDDYGSGQASLAYVKNLPVHELKIDREFITQIDSSPKNAAIVRSTTLLCRELGLTVVAEGAETAGEMRWLADNACDIVQGYGVARPMPADALLPWVRQHASDQRTTAAAVG